MTMSSRSLKEFATQFIHPLVMIVFASVIAWTIGSKPLFLMLVGAELVSVTLHQHMKHADGVFARFPQAAVVGALIWFAGFCLIWIGDLSLTASFVSLALLFTTQFVSAGWHLYIHKPESKIIFAAVVMFNLFASFVLTILVRVLC